MKPIFRTPSDRHYYFGYYDKSPVSADGKRHLALEVDFIDRLPAAADRARIGWFDLTGQEPRFREVAETRAFNWQQGCMLQWIGDRNSKVIYNDFLEGSFVSIILDVDTGARKVLPMAVYAVHPSGGSALCIDNERHHWCRRGYSYHGEPKPEKNRNIVPGDGIFLLDLATGERRTVAKVEDLVANRHLASMKNAVHYLEHMMFNPSGSRFAFFHRWKMAAGGIYARLYVSDVDGRNLHLVNDSGRMSHFCWKDDGEILGWGGISNPINSLRKFAVAKYLIKPLMPLYKRIVKGNAIDGTNKMSKLVTGDSYILFDTVSGKKRRLPLDFLDRDGHPSFHPRDRNRFVTDTYPNRDSRAKLLIYDIAMGSGEVVDEVKSIPVFDNSPNRCDLHPKWSFDGQFVSIDTMNEGVRGIYLYRMPNRE